MLASPQPPTRSSQASLMLDADGNIVGEFSDILDDDDGDAGDAAGAGVFNGDDDGAVLGQHLEADEEAPLAVPSLVDDDGPPAA
jgi:hypothetical protein